MIPLWAVLSLALLIPPEDLGLPDGFRGREGPTGPIYSKSWHEGEVRWAEKRLPRLLAMVEGRLGRRLDRRFATVLVYGAGELEEVVRALGGSVPRAGTRGVALPGRGAIVVRGDIVYSEFEDPTTKTLLHEIAHLVLHRRRDIDLPRWLDEGIASWAAGQSLGPRDEAHLALLARTRSLYRFDWLEEAFPEGSLSTTLAYQQSFLMVAYVDSFSADGSAVPRLLDRLEGGSPCWRALEEVTGAEREELEEGFRRWTVARRSFLGSLLAYFNLWTVASILCLIAIGRYLVRRRRALSRMEREEAAEEAKDPENLPE